MESIVADVQVTCPYSRRPRATASATRARSSNERVGLAWSWTRAAIITGRPDSAASDSRNGIEVLLPLVSMERPRPTSPRVLTSARVSASSADRSFDMIDGGVFHAEDLFISEQIQSAVASGAHDTFVFGCFEQHLRRFHENVQAMLKA